MHVSMIGHLVAQDLWQASVVAGYHKHQAWAVLQHQAVAVAVVMLTQAVPGAAD